jgi:hypothetical protein
MGTVVGVNTVSNHLGTYRGFRVRMHNPFTFLLVGMPF